MKVLNLRCGAFHGFEGWFAGEDDYRAQLDGGLLECPVCGDKAIVRLPSAPRLAKGVKPHHGESENRGAPEPSTRGSTMSVGVAEARWMRALQEVIARSEDVGERFAEEARRIHDGEAEQRPIRGQATLEDTVALQEEGIDVLSLSAPMAAKEQLH